jgi:rubredoxin
MTDFECMLCGSQFDGEWSNVLNRPRKPENCPNPECKAPKSDIAESSYAEECRKKNAQDDYLEDI